MILLSERLRLRPVEERDALEIVAIDSDPEVMRFLGSPKLTEERALAWIARARSYPVGTGYWILEREDAVLGWALLRPSRDAPFEMEVGYRLKREAWGQGYASEAARRLVQHAWEESTVPSILATTDARNVRSQSVMRKVGMHHVEDFLYDGVSPSVRYRIVRPIDPAIQEH